MKRAVRLERFYEATPERVFRALTDPAAMGLWLMENDFQPVLGHKFQFRSKPQGGWDGVTHCEVVELDPPRRVAYTWTGKNTDGSPSLAHTLVRWTLSPEGAGTRLVLEHEGFEGFGEVMVSFILGSGWKKMLATRLPAVIAGRDPKDAAGSTFWCRDLRLRRELPYPPELVWRAVSEREALGSWFMANDLVPELNASFTFRKKPQPGWDGVTYCQVTELDPPRRIALSYRGRASGVKTLACAGVESEQLDRAAEGVFTELDTVLCFAVEPGPVGAVLVLDHSGFKGFKQVIVSYVMGMGWGKVLGRLPRTLEGLTRGELPPPIV